MDLVSNFNERFKEAFQGRSVTDFAAEIGVSKQTISAYLTGSRKPKRIVAETIARHLNVSPAWLMGYDVPMYRQRSDEDDDVFKFPNIFPIETVRVPFLGEISCGEPVYASEEHESYVLTGTDIEADFCLRAHGDSMVNARILDGDIVFVKRCDMVDNGQIAVVIIDDETTLKRVFYHRDKNILILRPENPAYQDMVYTNDELNTIKILGKAVAFQSDVR